MDFTNPKIDDYNTPLDMSIGSFPSSLKPEESSYFDKKRDTDWKPIFSKLMDKTRRTDKWQSEATQGKASFGDAMQGRGGQVLENLGVVYPQQHSPMFIPGVEGKKSGIFGTAGGLAGALGTAAGIFGPLGMPIGAAVGGLIDTARG